MIIKLHTAVDYARHKEARIAKTLTRKDKIKGDRLVMVFLFLLTIVGAVIFA